MIQTWPSVLPRPERPSWQSAPQDARRKTQSETGPARYRRRYSSPAQLVSLSVILTRDQKGVFDRFFHVDCAQGTALFYMPDPTTDGWPLLTSDGSPILTASGEPLLLGGSWLCSWGDQLPAETIQGQEFKKTFSILVMP